MSKDNDTNHVVDPNQDDMIQPPPPSYKPNNTASQSYQPPAGPPPTSFYQAQPVGQQTYAPPEGAYIPPPPSSGYAPPSSSGYTPPAGNPGGASPNTVVYVVDGNDPAYGQQVDSRGVPVAMICFIFGICTWLGYLFGMCFLNSPDPRERFWARCCSIAAFLVSLIIIFSAIFGRY
ncbi:MAG: hypothetical protein JOS17DRAFT_759127 [Linnemannia elongata]|nr:MAG: hypothetical protein JOS17DRAFT_759127 [Linnemannia elongata]